MNSKPKVTKYSSVHVGITKQVFLAALFFFSFTSTVLAESYVYLKSSSGVLMGRVTYEKTFINEYIKINAFCAYKNITEGVICEYVDGDSPIANNPGGQVVLVGQGQAQGDTGIWGAISNVSNRLDGFIKSVTGRTEPTVPAGQVNIPAPVQTGTTTSVFQQQQVAQTPSPDINTTIQAPVGNYNSPSVSNQPNVVYQVIERAVPGPKGDKGDKGDTGASGSSNSTGSYTIGGQYNGSAVDPTGNANLTLLTVSGGTSLNTLNYNTSNSTTTNTTNLSATNGTITNLYVGTLSGNINSSTTNSILINASTTNTDNLNAGSATLTNSTSTNSYIANLTAGSTTLGSTTVTNITGGIASFVTAFLNSLTAVSAYISTLYGNSSNFIVSNASTSNATTSNANTFNGELANLSVINGGTINTTNLNATGTTQLTNVLASTTNSSTTNADIANVQVLNAGTANLTNLTATGTTQLTTVFASTTNATTSNATTFNGTTGNIGTGNFGTLNTTNLTATGTTQLTTLLASTSNASTTNTTDLNATNATLTNATSTNLNTSNLTSGSTTLGSTTASNLTVTGNLATSILNALSAILQTLFASTGYITTLYATTTNATTSNAVTFNGTTGNLNTGNFGTVNTTNLNATGTTQLTTLLASTSNASTTNTTDLNATNATVTNLYSPNFQTGLTNGYIWRGNSSNLNEATSSMYLADNGWLGLGTVSPTGNLDINQGTLTGGAQSALKILGIWNNPATIFNGINLDITNTSSHSNSNLLNLALGGSSVFKVSSAGNTTVTGNLGVAGTTTMSVGGIDMGSNKIINLALPTNNNDAVNKAYVDAAFASGVLWQSPVKTISTSTAPGAPATGDRYLLQTGATGFGACTIDQIAEWSGAAWTCFTAATGTTVFVDSGINQPYNFNGTAWNSISEQVNHNNLVNLQGGQSGEYYHLNSSQYNALNSVNAQLSQLQTTGTATQFVNLTLTGSLNMGGASGAATITSATSTNSFATNASSTNLFATIARIGTGIFQTLFSPLGYFTSLYATTTNATTSNAVTFNGTTGNITNINATTTNASTSNSTNLTTTNGTLTNATITNLSVTNFSPATFSVTGATLTNATSTNLYVANASVSALTVNCSAGTNVFCLNGNTFAGLATLGTNDANDIVFETNNLERVRVTNTGRLTFSNTSGAASNLFIGGGNETTTGTGNTSVGKFSLVTNTTGIDNTAFGFGALNLNDTGGGNSAFGRDALLTNTSGGGNSAFGQSTLRANTTGTANSAFGVAALITNTTGTYNTAVGYGSLLANTTANENSAFGYYALSANTTGVGNIAFGYTALSANTTANNNAAFGNSALLVNTTGAQNIAIGNSALVANTTGSFNSALGIESLKDLTTGTNNSAFGYQTGLGITTGSNNTIIGSGVNGLAAGLSNNIIIADGSGNRRINVDSSGFVGIGTTAPTARLQVTTSASTKSAVFTDATNSTGFVSHPSANVFAFGGDAGSHLALYTNNTEKVRITTDGNVGVGTTAPLNALHISSSTSYISGLRLGISSSTTATAATGKVLTVDANGDVVLATAAAALTTVSNTIHAYNSTTSTTTASGGTAFTMTTGSTISTTPASGRPYGTAIYGNYLYIANNGFDTVSVYDISTPASPVFLNEFTTNCTIGNIAVYGTALYLTDYTGNTLKVYNLASSATNPAFVTSLATGNYPLGLAVSDAGYLYVANNTDGTIRIFNVSTPLSPTFSSTYTLGFVNPSGVAVVGTTMYVSFYSLDVIKAYSISSPTAPSLSSSVSASTSPATLLAYGGKLYASNYGSNSISVYNILNSPGIPAYVRTVTSGGTGPAGMSGNGNYIYGVNNTGTSLTTYSISSASVENPIDGGGITSTVSTSTLSTYEFSVPLYIKPSLSYSTSYSAVGIQSTIVRDALIVNGAIRARGFTVDTAADLAETFPTETGKSISDGTVVAFSDTTKAWKPEAGGKEYQMSTIKVAGTTDRPIGVIATNPGFLLGGTNGSPVAFSGRVPVRITQENGVVKKGDRLTLSSTIPGHAMKQTEAAVSLGIALSDDDGTGTVLIFVETGFAIPDKKTGNEKSENVLTSMLKGDITITNIKDILSKYISDMANEVVTKVLKTELLCVGRYCVNEDQFKKMMETSGLDTTLPDNSEEGTSGGNNNQGDSGSSTGGETSTSTNATTTDPVSGGDESWTTGTTGETTTEETGSTEPTTETTTQTSTETESPVTESNPQ